MRYIASNKHILGRMYNTLGAPMDRLLRRSFQRGMKCCRKVCAPIVSAYYYAMETQVVRDWSSVCFNMTGATSTLAYGYSVQGQTTPNPYYNIQLYDYNMTTLERLAVTGVSVFVVRNSGSYGTAPTTWPNGYSSSLVAQLDIFDHYHDIDFIEIRVDFVGSDWSYSRWLYVTPCA